MRRIGNFVLAVTRHWGILFTGGLGIGVVNLWQITGHPLSPKVGWVIAGAAVLCACFKAWNEQFERAERAEKDTEDSVIHLPPTPPGFAQLEAATPPEEELEPRPKPTIDVVDARVTSIIHDDFGSFVEHPDRFPAVVMTFRNHLAKNPGQQNESFRDVTANLIYEGVERAEHIDYGNWLGQYTRFVDFKPGETRDLVIAMESPETAKIVGLYNQKRTDPRRAAVFHSGRTIYGPEERNLPNPPCKVTVTLVSKGVTLFSGAYVLDVDKGGALQFTVADRVRT